MQNVIEVESLVMHYGKKLIHDGISFSVQGGEILAVIGGSGCGKTSLLLSLFLLKQPTSGVIRLFGEEVLSLPEEKLQSIQARLGVAFQHNALFSSLNVLENIRFPLDELTQFSTEQKNALALFKLALVGLDQTIAKNMPTELSGGMQKRVALARALAFDPEIIFLDEPTSGLDPVNARKFIKLVHHLKETLGLTVVMVTHDKDSLYFVDRILFLGEGKILGEGSLEMVSQSQHPLIATYFAKEDLCG